MICPNGSKYDSNEQPGLPGMDRVDVMIQSGKQQSRSGVQREKAT